MPSKEREYRNMELRIQQPQEGEEPSFFVEGYASTFEEYTLFDFPDEEWRERIEPTAFDEADMSDVVFLRDHEGRVMARTKNGTIDLKVDENGLFSKTDLSKTAAARDMYDDIEAGNYQQMSFAFTVEDDHFEDTMENGKKVRFAKSTGEVID